MQKIYRKDVRMNEKRTKSPEKMFVRNEKNVRQNQKRERTNQRPSAVSQLARVRPPGHSWPCHNWPAVQRPPAVHQAMPWPTSAVRPLAAALSGHRPAGITRPARPSRSTSGLYVRCTMFRTIRSHARSRPRPAGHAGAVRSFVQVFVHQSYSSAVIPASTTLTPVRPSCTTSNVLAAMQNHQLACLACHPLTRLAVGPAKGAKAVRPGRAVRPVRPSACTSQHVVTTFNHRPPRPTINV